MAWRGREKARRFDDVTLQSDPILLKTHERVLSTNTILLKTLGSVLTTADL